MDDVFRTRNCYTKMTEMIHLQGEETKEFFCDAALFSMCMNLSSGETKMVGTAIGIFSRQIESPRNDNWNLLRTNLKRAFVSILALLMSTGASRLSAANPHSQPIENQQHGNNVFRSLDSLGKMEGSFIKGLSSGWRENCYGVNKYRLSADSSDVHSGRYAQRMTCLEYQSGGVQIRYIGLNVREGEYYTLSLWMKGNMQTRVYAGIRENPSPYISYIKGEFLVDNEWQPYMVIGKAGKSDTSCGIYIMISDTGTLLIDDVRVEEGDYPDAISSELPVRKGNLVYNSGFEVGDAGWVPKAAFAIMAGDAMSGRFYARLGKGGIESQPFPVVTGQRFTVSACIRSRRTGTQCSIGVSEWADFGGDTPSSRDKIDTTVAVTATWHRYSFTAILIPQYGHMYDFEFTCNDSVDVDNVQVEEGNLTSYSPKDPVEVGVDSSTPWCLLGDSVTFRVWFSCVTARQFELKYTLSDLWGSSLKTIDRNYSSSIEDSLRIRMNSPGIFRLSVKNVGSSTYGENWVGVFPKQREQPSTESRLGTHVAPTLPVPGNAFLASKAMGAGWIRLHDFGDYCHWYKVEPQRGNYVWYDSQIEALSSEGFNIVGNLGLAPPWAGRNDSTMVKHQTGWTNAFPRDTSEWKEYISQTVSHYKRTIHYWEIWNEPWGKLFFDGTPKEYVELLAIAYRTIKSIDSGSVVIGGCFSPGSDDWTDAILANHGLDFMDEVSYHDYLDFSAVDVSSNDSIPQIVNYVEHLKAAMERYGDVKSIIMTEGGVRSPAFDSWIPDGYFKEDARSAAATLAKGFAEMLESGVAKVFYYFTGYDNGASPWYSTMVNGSTVLLDYSGRPKPTMMAYSAMATLLNGSIPVKSVYRSNFTALLFKKSQESIAICWGAKPLHISITGTQVFNMMGVPLLGDLSSANEPVLITSNNLDPASLLSELERANMATRGN